jgi:hypothetical protein
MKSRLLVIIALFLLAASSAFANEFFYEVSLDTSSLNGTDGFLYFQYIPVNGASSTATIEGFTGGTLVPSRSSAVVDDSAVTGLLPSYVTFANTNAVNDYNQGITFGNSIFFNVLLSDPAPGGDLGGSSSFSLSLFQDEFGYLPLLTNDGLLFTTDLMNDGTEVASVFADQASVNQVPEAGTLWLLGSGLLGIVGVCRKMKK